MTIKTVIASIFLAILPGLSLAMGCEREHSANACDVGTTWDDVSQECVEEVSS